MIHYFRASLSPYMNIIDWPKLTCIETTNEQHSLEAGYARTLIRYTDLNCENQWLCLRPPLLYESGATNSKPRKIQNNGQNV